MGEKPAKYWDYRECAWVTCPATREEVTVPAQPSATTAQPDESTAVENSR